jgi:uncharacterized protein YdeI (YjbR/CyaY-like superfamily)
MDVIYFKTPAELRAWFEAHHKQAKELWIGFYKKSTAKVGITIQEALDEALCFGWIDGVRKSVDAESSMMRYSPRRAKSAWSLVNIKRAQELIAAGRMQPAGLKAFEQHDLAKAQQLQYERREQPLAANLVTIFQDNPGAWHFFQAQAPSYRQSATWWIMSAKQDVTRQKRLALLIEACAQERRMPELMGKTKGSSSSVA